MLNRAGLVVGERRCGTNDNRSLRVRDRGGQDPRNRFLKLSGNQALASNRIADESTEGGGSIRYHLLASDKVGKIHRDLGDHTDPI